MLLGYEECPHEWETEEKEQQNKFQVSPSGSPIQTSRHPFKKKKTTKPTQPKLKRHEGLIQPNETIPEERENATIINIAQQADPTNPLAGPTTKQLLYKDSI